MNSPEVMNDSLSSKIVGLHTALTEQDIPYAFGGAIALAYHCEPRATIDIDINIFLQPQQHELALNVLDTLTPISDRGALEQEIADRGQGKVDWAGTRIDIFFSETKFHESMASRALPVDFEGTEIHILSAEDLMVCKVIFSRQKDWVDIEKVCTTQGSDLDKEYMVEWIAYFLGEDDLGINQLLDLLRGCAD